MIKISFLISAVACCSISFAQPGITPPDNVRNSFHGEYPQSQPVKWNGEGHGYNVRFNDRDNDNGESIAHYRSDGKRIDTHIQYANQDIPQPITDHLHRRYAGSEDYRVVRIERQHDHDIYEVRFRHGRDRRRIYLNESGREESFRDNHW
jgi:hypothetical protein